MKWTESANEIWTDYVILHQKKISWETSTKSAAWKLVPDPFVFAKN